jgi:hypothetical protein
MGPYLRLAMDAWPYRSGRPSHPPNPGQSFSPTDPPIALQSLPGTRLLPPL